MAKNLGPTFGSELIKAGLIDLPLVWAATDETMTGRESLTPEQNTTLDQVIAAHDPAKKPIEAISRTQALIALQRTNKLDAVKTAVAQDPENQIWFDTAPTWHRDNPRIAALAPAVGLTDQDLNDLFALAKTITD